MLALIDHALAAGKAAGYARASITFYIGSAAPNDAMPGPDSCLPKRSGIRNLKPSWARRASARY